MASLPPPSTTVLRCLGLNSKGERCGHRSRLLLCPSHMSRWNTLSDREKALLTECRANKTARDSWFTYSEEIAAISKYTLEAEQLMLVREWHTIRKGEVKALADATHAKMNLR